MKSNIVLKTAIILMGFFYSAFSAQEYRHPYKNGITKNGAYLNTIVFQGMMIGKGYKPFKRTFVHPLNFEVTYRGNTGKNTEYCIVSYEFKATEVIVNLKRSVYQNVQTYELYPNRTLPEGEKLYNLHHDFL